MLTIEGTVDKKLISYIERVYNYLGLDVCLDLEVVKNLIGESHGYANGDNEEVSISIARNSYGEKISREQMMVNIAHEMIHAKQYNTEQMINAGITVEDGNPVPVVIWEGKEYINETYENQPWEYDAYSKEREVYNANK